MQGRLQKSDKIVRLVSAIVCTFATIVFLFIVGGLGVSVYQHKSHPGTVSLVAILFTMGLLTVFTSYMSWRFWRGQISSNGVTTLPTWFILLFGIFLLGGLVVGVAFDELGKIFLFEVGVFALFVILISRIIAHRERSGK